MRRTWIYSTTTTTFSIFTPGKLIGKLLPPVAAAAAAASSCGRWCAQGRVDAAVAVTVLVIQGSICAGNLKDGSGAALLPLAAPLHVKTSTERPPSAYAVLAAPLPFPLCCRCPLHRFPPKGKFNFLPGVKSQASWSATNNTSGKWTLDDAAKAADALLTALTD